MGTARHAFSVLLLAALGCSADHVERRREYAACDLTTATLRAVLDGQAAGAPCGRRAPSPARWTEADWAEARKVARFPIGTPPFGLRCGEKIGTTPKSLACRSGGSGSAACSAREPIASSVPFFTDRVLTWDPHPGRLSENSGSELPQPRSPAPARTFDRQLRAASHRHDFCYQHGLGTFGRDRAACDSDFLADALRICRMSERDTPGAYAGVVLGHCMAHARLAYLAVTVGGRSAERDNTHGTCEYEEGINPARDHVVTGRFHDPGSGLARPGLTELRAVAPDRLEVKQFVLGADGRVRGVHTASHDVGRFSLPAPPNGLCGMEAAPADGRCTFRELGLTAADLLNIGPRTVKLDGTLEDRLVLLGVHGLRSGHGANAGGAFALALPRAGSAAPVSPGWLRTPPEEKAMEGRGALPENWLASQIEVFSGEIRVGRFLPNAPGEQIAVVAVETEADSRGSRRLWSSTLSGGEQKLHLRLVHWPGRRGEGPPVLEASSYDCGPQAGAGSAAPAPTCWRSADDGQPELFRRFQYRPFVFRDEEAKRQGIRFLVRDKADPLPAARPPAEGGSERVESAGAFTSGQAAAPPPPPPDYVPQPQDAELDVVSVGPPRACAARGEGGYDWLGCTANGGGVHGERRLPAARGVGRRAWVKRIDNWQRSVYPLLDVSRAGKEGSLLAAAFLGRPPSAGAGAGVRQETFWLALADVRSDSDQTGSLAYAALPPEAAAPNAADWFVLPFRAAQVGPGGDQGLVFVRVEAPVAAGGASARRLVVMTAVPEIEAAPWNPHPSGRFRIERFVCPVPERLDRYLDASVDPGDRSRAVRHDALVHVPFVTVSTEGSGDGLVWITRDIIAPGAAGETVERQAHRIGRRSPRAAIIEAPTISYDALLPTADGGWIVPGSPDPVCRKEGPWRADLRKDGPDPRWGP